MASFVGASWFRHEVEHVNDPGFQITAIHHSAVRVLLVDKVHVVDCDHIAGQSVLRKSKTDELFEPFNASWPRLRHVVSVKGEANAGNTSRSIDNK